jgi:hypothetical protein
MRTIIFVPSSNAFRFDQILQVADRVDLRGEVFACELWILVEQRLNPVVVLLKQGSDLFPLVRGEFQGC